MEKKMEAQSEKMTYTELKEMASQLQGQIVQMNKEYQRLVTEYNKAMEMVMGKRLDALFQVLKYKEQFDPEFVKDTSNNIKEMLTFTPEAPQENDVKTEE